MVVAVASAVAAARTAVVAEAGPIVALVVAHMVVAEVARTKKSLNLNQRPVRKFRAGFPISMSPFVFFLLDSLSRTNSGQAFLISMSAFSFFVFFLVDSLFPELAFCAVQCLAQLFASAGVLIIELFRGLPFLFRQAERRQTRALQERSVRL
jgi:hypothetical protein